MYVKYRTLCVYNNNNNMESQNKIKIADSWHEKTKKETLLSSQNMFEENIL